MLSFCGKTAASILKRLAMAAVLAMLMSGLAMAQPQSTQAAPLMQAQRCFPEVAFCISGQIRAYWEGNGGLPVFGFPVTAEAKEAVEGKIVVAQWFERDRLEIHPDGVKAGRLGARWLEILGMPYDPDAPRYAPQDGCFYFGETGHNVCGGFLAKWKEHGLERIGFPLSEMTTETFPDGTTHTVQYFERRRMELHTVDGKVIVLFGLLGSLVLEKEGNRNVAPPPEPPAEPDWTTTIGQGEFLVIAKENLTYRIQYNGRPYFYEVTEVRFTPECGWVGKERAFSPKRSVLSNSTQYEVSWGAVYDNYEFAEIRVFVPGWHQVTC